MTWIEDRESPTRLLCVTGAAGAGKSAIQQTIAQHYARSKSLAASFFFSSSDLSRDNLSAFVPTVAYQLGQGHPRLKQWIGETVDNDHLIFRKSLKTQVDILIVGPVERLQSQVDPATFSSLPYLITIDAPDECLAEKHQAEKHQAELLSVIYTSLLCNNRMPFRIFLATRPELSVRTGLEGPLKGIVYHLRLSDDFDATDDIRRTLRRRLREIGARSGDPLAHPDPWPTEDNIELLVEAASGQFVYSATVIRYIGERRGSPIKRLQTVLDRMNIGLPSTTAPFAELDLLYASILSNAKEAWEVANPDSPHHFVILLRIFETYRRSGHPLSEFLVSRHYEDSNALSVLLGLNGTTLDTITLDLRSLVSVVKEGHLHLYHRSFSEFLTTETRSKDLYRSGFLVGDFLICCLMRQICNGPDPVVVKGAIQSLPSTVWWRFHIDRAEICEISNDLFEAFLHFTRHRGWDKFLKVWLAEVRYTGHPYPVAGVTKGGLLRLFALVLEYAVDKDSEEELIASIREYYKHLCEQNAPFMECGMWEASNCDDFQKLPFFYLGLHDSNIDI